MPERSLLGAWWLYVVAGVIVGLMIGSCPGTGTDADLARTARDAVELAREAQDRDQSAVLWTGRFRLVALIIGVTVPLIIAYLLWRASHTGEPDAAEIIHAAEKYLSDDTRYTLPDPAESMASAPESPQAHLPAMTPANPTTTTSPGK